MSLQRSERFNNSIKMGAALLLASGFLSAHGISQATKPAPEDPLLSASTRYYHELQKHALAKGEKIEEQKIVFKDGASVVIRHYTSDHCTEIIESEHNKPAQSVWLFDDVPTGKPGMPLQSPNPKAIPQSMNSRPESQPQFIKTLFNPQNGKALRRDVLLQGIPGNCVGPPHPGVFTQTHNWADSNGFYTVFTTWDDNCSGWQWWNRYTGAYGPFIWTACYH